MSASVPKILVIGGLDPSGAAGLQADVLTVAHFGAHGLPICTVNTIQSSDGFAASQPVDETWLLKQVAFSFENEEVSAIKLGAIMSPKLAEFIAEQAKQRNIPLVVDPVIQSTSGGTLIDEATLDALILHVLPTASIWTPNQPELETVKKRLAEHNAELSCATLLTGGHSTSDETLINQLIINGRTTNSWHIDRAAGQYRGTGCAFSAAIAALLAGQERLPHHSALLKAIEAAQLYLSASIEQAYPISDEQHCPNRMPESRDTHEH